MMDEQLQCNKTDPIYTELCPFSCVVLIDTEKQYKKGPKHKHVLKQVVHLHMYNESIHSLF